MREVALPGDGSAEGSGPILEARDLCFDLGRVRLIDGVNLAVRPGERLVVMGPNGAGKSLLVRLLHGLLVPSAGEVLWGGRPLGPDGRRAQSMVFQRPVMLRRSAASNLRFALAVRGVRGSERSAREAEAMKRARLSGLSRKPARVLSVGEQQRLAVARALVCAPRMLILDEPAASLDPASTRDIEELIMEANSEGVTIILVTHDAGQARRLGTDVLFLHSGRVAEEGSVSEVLDSPRSKAARAWLSGRLHVDSAEPAVNRALDGGAR